MILDSNTARYFKAILGKTGGATYQVPRLDSSTHAMTIIDYAHHEIHGGSTYTTMISTADLDSNALRIQFLTPPGKKEAHMFISAFVSGQATFTLTEAYSGGAAGGTALTPLNRNRGSSKTSSLIGTHAATAGLLTQGGATCTGGTVLIPAENLGAGLNKQVGQSRNENEWILKANTLYQVELESSTNLIIATLKLDWYEHTEKNA